MYIRSFIRSSTFPALLETSTTLDAGNVDSYSYSYNVIDVSSDAGNVDNVIAITITSTTLETSTIDVVDPPASLEDSTGPICKGFCFWEV